MENLCVRAVKQSYGLARFISHFKQVSEKINESEKRTELRQSTLAAAFPHAGVLPNILALLVTLLLALIAVVLIVRYVDICVINVGKYNDPSTRNDDQYVANVVGAGIVCGFLAVSSVVCLSMAGELEGWHYTLMTVEMLLVGYQTWRAFLGN